MTSNVTSLFRNPNWLLHQLEPDNGRVLLVGMTRQRYRDASFLDDRALDAQSSGFWIPMERALTAPPPDAHVPLAIFHIGHCGSTLLSRLLGELPDVLSLREPLPLRTLAQLKLSDDTDRELEDAIWRWYGRRYPDDVATIVKVTSSASGLVGSYLEQPGGRAIALQSTLENYLATLLKGSMQDISAFADQRVKELGSLFPNLVLPHTAKARVNRAVVAWVVATTQFERAPTVLRVDFDDLLDMPMASLQLIVDHLGIAVADHELEALASHQIWTRYSKQPATPYSIADRHHDLSLAKRRFAPEIDAAIRWYENELLPALQAGSA